MKIWITVDCQLRITLQRATQKTSENPTKIRNKLQKHSKKIICSTVSSINVYFHFIEMMETILHWGICSVHVTSKGLHICWWACVSNVLTINCWKTIKLCYEIYVHAFRTFFYWNAFILHQCPTGHCSLNNFVRVSCYVPKKSWRCWIFRINYSRHDKKRA